MKVAYVKVLEIGGHDIVRKPSNVASDQTRSCGVDAAAKPGWRTDRSVGNCIVLGWLPLSVR
jgi:hypothetical protein